MDKSINIGSKIKSVRTLKEITFDELVERSGLDREEVKRIEENEQIPCLSPLIKIARVLGVRLGTFLDDQQELGPIVTRECDCDNEINFSNGASDVKKHMLYHSLSKSKAGRHMESFIIDIVKEDKQSYSVSSHEGEEFIYVVEGEIEIIHGKNKYQLKKGDSIYYDSIVPHHVHGSNGNAAKILAVVYTPA